jgi:hypothetical protein
MKFAGWAILQGPKLKFLRNVKDCVKRYTAEYEFEYRNENSITE